MKFELLLFLAWAVFCTLWIFNMMAENERVKEKKRKQQGR